MDNKWLLNRTPEQSASILRKQQTEFRREREELSQRQEEEELFSLRT